MKRRVGRTLVVLLVCLVGGPAVAALTYYGWDWGGGTRDEFAQWLMAITSAGTLLAAVTAAIYAAGAFKLEVRREETLREDRRREQASLVAAWATGVYQWDYFVTRPDGTEVSGPTLHRVGLALRNASQLPVTSVHVHLDLRIDGKQHTLPTTELDLRPPSDEPFEFWVIPADVIEVPEHLPENPYEIKARVRLQFRDASGVIWMRDHLGRLDEPAAFFGT